MQQHKIYNAQKHAIRNTPYRNTNTMKEFRNHATGTDCRPATILKPHTNKKLREKQLCNDDDTC